jgi:hypothetical protein
MKAEVQRRLILLPAILSVWLAVSLAFGFGLYSSGETEDPQFGGTFAQLEPVQQRLVQDWFQHFNQIMGADLRPEVAYGQLPFSTRTTFEAVTNAAMNTQLTDAVSAESLGTALDLIRLIETVRGEVAETRGDVQFRIYAVLVPGAVDLLERSSEFKRGRDNTHYHVDYPVNYRLDGTPSLQFSITEDGQRADIDVDYRSSSFPKLFFDGHLKAANSDVRAWNNYDVHLGRWQGFVNWWRNLFGVPVKGKPEPEGVSDERHLYPPNPPVSDHKDLSVAVNDFLTSWLIRQQPEQAMPYYATTAFPCIRDLELDLQTSDMAPLRILRDMKELNSLLGKVEQLEDAVEAVEPGDSGLEPVDQPYAAEFSLSRIAPERVSQLECLYAAQSIALKHDKSFKDYFAVGMKLKHGPGSGFFQIWTKQEGYWKIVAFHRDPFVDVSAVPDSRSNPGSQLRPVESMTVDPSLVARVEDFMDVWLIRKDDTTAVSYFSDKALDCVGLLDQPPQSPGSDPRSRLQQDLKSFADGLGDIASLEAVLTETEPWNPALHRIAHRQQNAYTLTSYSTELARQQDCRLRRERGGDQKRRFRGQGNFFSISFQLRNAGKSAPILILVWSQEKKDWEIVSLDVEQH